MPELERIVALIEREGETSTYRATVSGLGGRDVQAVGLALGPDVRVHLSAGDSTLAELLRRLFPGSVEIAPEELAFFDQRTQLEIGHHLFDQLFGRLPLDPKGLDELVAREGQELRIVTNDEYLVRLPWVLLARDETVLAKGKRWAVSLARDRTTTDVSLRSLPRVLLVMPEPLAPGLARTGREEHAERLRRLIEEKADARYRWEEYWKVVHTWQELDAALGDRDVVYFYGHGEGDLASSRLLFETSREERGKHAVTMDQVALRLGDASGVRLIYLNCCSGDAGGFLGAGMQLRPAVPAVFTNRTFVRIPMAQQSGEVFFEQLFLEGALPHAAYAALCRSMVLPSEPGRSPRPASWMTPVLHARYGRWESPRVRAAPALPRQSTALQLFDRSDQEGALKPLDSRLRSTEKGGHAVLWYGAERQGVGRFHHHLRHGLALRGNRVQELKEFDWPPELAARVEPVVARNSLLDRFLATLGVVTPERVSPELRALALPTQNDKCIACYLAVSFPFPGAERFSTGEVCQLLLQLVETFDEGVAPFFEEPFVPVLGLAVETTDPEGFGARLTTFKHDLRLEWIKLIPTLPQLGAVKASEIESHLQDATSTRRLDSAQLDEAVSFILEKTAGRYDDVVDFLADDGRLRQLVDQVRFPKTRTG